MLSIERTCMFRTCANWKRVYEPLGVLIPNISDTVCRDILALVLFSPTLSAGEFNTRRIPLSQIIFLLKQLYLGEFKTGRNCFQV